MLSKLVNVIANLLLFADSQQLEGFDRQELAFIMNTTLAHRRVRVVQLLIVGLVGLLLGLLGNFFVGFSCHFASRQVQVGQNGDAFELHFGLWKYSPPDSALNGYNYCYPYSGFRQAEAPIIPRISNGIALLAGSYSLIIVWTYLILGYATKFFWRTAIVTSIIASLSQLATLSFFVSYVCWGNDCAVGPASIVAFVTALAWIVFGWEIYYNRPIAFGNPELDKNDSAPFDDQNNTVGGVELASRGNTYEPPEIT